MDLEHAGDAAAVATFGRMIRRAVENELDKEGAKVAMYARRETRSLTL